MEIFQPRTLRAKASCDAVPHATKLWAQGSQGVMWEASLRAWWRKQPSQETKGRVGNFLPVCRARPAYGNGSCQQPNRNRAKPLPAYGGTEWAAQDGTVQDALSANLAAPRINASAAACNAQQSAFLQIVAQRVNKELRVDNMSHWVWRCMADPAQASDGPWAVSERL